MASYAAPGGKLDRALNWSGIFGPDGPAQGSWWSDYNPGSHIPRGHRRTHSRRGIGTLLTPVGSRRRRRTYRPRRRRTTRRRYRR